MFIKYFIIRRETDDHLKSFHLFDKNVFLKKAYYQRREYYWREIPNTTRETNIPDWCICHSSQQGFHLCSKINQSINHFFIYAQILRSWIPRTLILSKIQVGSSCHMMRLLHSTVASGSSRSSFAAFVLFRSLLYPSIQRKGFNKFFSLLLLLSLWLSLWLLLLLLLLLMIYCWLFSFHWFAKMCFIVTSMHSSSLLSFVPLRRSSRGPGLSFPVRTDGCPQLLSVHDSLTQSIDQSLNLSIDPSQARSLLHLPRTYAAHRSRKLAVHWLWMSSIRVNMNGYTRIIHTLNKPFYQVDR